MKYLKRFNEATLINKDEPVDIGNMFPDCLIDYADDTVDSAYEKGREAKAKGYDFDENPFVDNDELMDAWATGYEDMKNNTY